MGYLQPGQSLKPQQLVIADTLAAPLSSFVIEIPRRASKTTSIFIALLGRCASRPGYKVTFSAQSGIAGSRQFLEWQLQLDAATPPNDLNLPPWLRGRPQQMTKAQQRQTALFGDDFAPTGEANLTGGRGFKIMKGEVNKGIYFDNGSSFVILKPDGGAYRGRAADVSWLDEAQEIPIEDGDDLLSAIRPLQDTRPGSSLIVSGTAGEVRQGIFWDLIARGRKGDPKVGIVDYAAPEDTPWETVTDRRAALKLVESLHPGVNTLTTMDVMAERYDELTNVKWAREYASMWPETFGQAVIDPDQWERARLARKVAKPVRVAFAYAVKPGGSSAAIVAAWRSKSGVAYIEVIDYRPGTAWLPKRAQELSVRYPGPGMAYDRMGEGEATATEMEQLRPRPKLRVQTYRETAAGCVQILRDLERGTLRHFDQVDLNTAIPVVAKREVRGDAGVFLWTPVDRQRGDDITCWDAATRALRNWDQHYSRTAGNSKPIMGV